MKYQCDVDKKIQECRFHLSQAWYRRAQKLGSNNSLYSEKNSIVVQYLKLFFSLTLRVIPFNDTGRHLNLYLPFEFELFQISNRFQISYINKMYLPKK